MAFNAEKLNLLACAGGFSLWHYRTKHDPLKDVCGNNYFGRGTPFLKAGDMVLITAKHGARLVAVTLSDIGTVSVEPLQ